MSYIIDRRLNAKNKSAVNRQRFLRRYRQQIQKAVSDAVSERSITDIDKGGKVSIPTRDISEPSIYHGQGGHNERVLPGNKHFSEGDKIARPESGGGQGSGGNASDSGEGMDDFSFTLSQEEFLDFMFDGLELPNLIKRQLSGLEEFKTVRAGIANEGQPGRINIVRSLRSANMRRIALTAGKRKQLAELEQELLALDAMPEAERDQNRIALILAEVAKLEKAIGRIPWLDTFDLKYNLHIKQPIPRSKAVMFCIMDVSGSMDQATKDIAKRFFILLYLFLQRNYEKTEIVFIRHHTSAKEVDEDEFFHSRETGGTVVSSALKLMQEIIQDRYSPDIWNIYGAQASDGDNWGEDSDVCKDILVDGLLSSCQYFSYIEITNNEHQALWATYESIRDEHPDYFSLQHIRTVSDIYPVFRELFHKKVA
ncbi:YeaH/YhbH family protein [Cellvibrio sp. NN19]|uniref:YeaH/YhbH family protein n=1 Tax=Cellvibrio chitinivorans TaxID=3102792 RepID=UPI002B40A438|nr:YeaH/YhbH family protein [Cellvibrio sp. NN19]